MARSDVDYPPLNIGENEKPLWGTVHYSLPRDIYDIPGHQLFIKFVLPEGCQGTSATEPLFDYFRLLEQMHIEKPNIVVTLSLGWPVCFRADVAMTKKIINQRVDDEHADMMYCENVV